MKQADCKTNVAKKKMQEENQMKNQCKQKEERKQAKEKEW